MAGRTLIAFAGFYALASATTLVAIWSPNQLLIGADSNVVTSVPNVLGTACKISQLGSTYFAFSGLVEDKTVGYNVSALAQEAADSSGTLSDRMNRFVTVLRDPLAKAVASLKQDSPDQYAYLQQDHPVLQAIFAEKEPGPPALGVATFALGPDGKLADYTRLIAQGDDGRGPRIIYAGKQDHIRAYLSTHREWFLGDQAQLVRNLIKSEIDASRGEVGGAIDILSIEPNSAHWLQKKPECR